MIDSFKIYSTRVTNNPSDKLKEDGSKCVLQNSKLTPSMRNTNSTFTSRFSSPSLGPNQNNYY